ncbi:MAG: hypothetical protein M9947_00175 [Thermomicrobiales bacterium]|nr:hypothetical protein [Thermomicrobiales bacterium]
MNASLLISLRSFFDRMVVAIVILAFLSIPVQCDAAVGPHSVFLSPVEAGVARAGDTDHEHPGSTTQSAHHSEQSASGSHGADHHHHASEGETDIASQRSAGSGFDAPFNVREPAPLGLDRAATQPRALFTRSDRLIQQDAPGPVTPPPQ